MKASTQVAIIGSGVTGLSTAYSLVEKGCSDVVILEKDYLSAGASTRNGGGVRAQFLTEENIMLAKWSIERFRKLGTELNTNFWFRQGGYLFVAESEEELATLRKAVEFQRKHGLRTRMVDCDEARSIVPEMACEAIVGGCFRKGDGVLFPFPLLLGYAESLRSRGVAIETHCEVKGIAKRSDGFEVTTSRGVLRADKVLNAAGAWSSAVAKMLGVDVPTQPERHQIMVSEPLAPFLDPMIVTLRDGFYMSQGPRGELVGGITEKKPHGKDTRRSSTGFCQQMSARIVSLFPRLAGAKMMRQWAGFYDVSPDANPILDAVPDVEGAYLACGYSGHGFMISPAVGEFMASIMLGDRPAFPREPYKLARFRTGEIRAERMVIG